MRDKETATATDPFRLTLSNLFDQRPTIQKDRHRCMPQNQLWILLILSATAIMFLWGRWRHDMVSLGALLSCVAAGLVPAAEAFVGFGHPAVITVACVLILSQCLQNSGAVDALSQRLIPASSGPTVTIAVLTGLGAALSAFMNNVGALALLMPVAMQAAIKQSLPPGKMLMPLAFGTILGGMTTLIGTPPNLIVSGFRAESGAGGFAMFDYTPVGLGVAAGGVLFVVLVGWRLVPARERAGIESFEVGAYITEARVTEQSKIAGKTLREMGEVFEEADAQVVGLIRNDIRVTVPHSERLLRAGDILVIEAEPESLSAVLACLKLKLVEDVPIANDEAKEPKPDDLALSASTMQTGEVASKKRRDSESVALQELVVQPESYLIGRSATEIQLRTRFGINLLALSRQGHRTIKRLRSIAVKAGDVLLLQGVDSSISSFAAEFGCVPLAQRSIRIPNKRQAVTATAIMSLAIAGAAFGFLPASVSFSAGVLAAMILRVVSPKTVYEGVDWPVIVLLGAMIPVAEAMASTGAADVVARLLLDHVAQGNAVIGLALILIVTMTLSDFMNNAATAAVMCPIAISTSGQLEAGSDSFLMAVAIGSSCAFLTPIGHQNNTLILGPGGFRFGDYWRLGLPVEILVIAASIPLLLYFWPL